MLNRKGLAAAHHNFVMHFPGAASWLRDDDFRTVIAAYLAASMPEDVKGLLDGLEGLPAGDVLDEFDAEAIQKAVTALASLSAQVEELERLKNALREIGKNLHHQRIRAETAEASLVERDRIIAEKDKALELVAESGKFSCFDDEAWSAVNAARDRKAS